MAKIMKGGRLAPNTPHDAQSFGIGLWNFLECQELPKGILALCRIPAQITDAKYNP